MSFFNYTVIKENKLEFTSFSPLSVILFSFHAKFENMLWKGKIKGKQKQIVKTDLDFPWRRMSSCQFRDLLFSGSVHLTQHDSCGKGNSLSPDMLHTLVGLIT